MIVRLLAGIVVVSFSLFLIGLAVVAVSRPTLAERFFKSFASSARSHYVEQIFRLLIGASIITLAPVMWHGELFQLIGWIVVVTSMGFS